MNNKRYYTRRNALKWVAPVVVSVSLPAHAATSSNETENETISPEELIDILRPILFGKESDKSEP